MQGQQITAVVGLGAILPDAHDVNTFWNNILSGRYSIDEVPPDRWSKDLYYDPDPAAPDKTYSKIGAFVRGYQFDPLKNGIAIPPKVLAVMDFSQQWAIAASQQALKDYGYPERKLDPERVAVIFGNALAGETHYRSTFRLLLPEYLDSLASVPEFAALPEAGRQAILQGVSRNIHARIPQITEDTMPGELGNIIAGRVANVFNFSGPNYITDAACASSLAAIQGAIDGLLSHKFDAVLTGGIDRNMGPESFIKFSKIGALSADGSRPYADGANGFVMGEGAVVFLLKRLEDAERDGDRIYAVIRGIGGSSDGKGKGITAPNPLGQQRAMERAWRDAGVNPELVGLVEGHGTSTRVGDVTEVNSLDAIFGPLGLKNGSVVLGSVKSNIGHLKSAAGAVGTLKTVLALHHHILPPSANFERPNPAINFASLPFRVTREAADWPAPAGNYRFAGVSSFGFGGTNFHLVLEEYLPGVAGSQGSSFAVPGDVGQMVETLPEAAPSAEAAPQPARHANEQIKTYVLDTVSEKTGYPVEMLDLELDLEADLGIDTVKQAELFAAVRTHYGIPRREDLRLSDYNTLTKVIGFVEEALGSGTSELSVEKPQSSTESIFTSPESVQPIQAGSTLKPFQGLFFASAETAAGLLEQVRSQAAALYAGNPPVSAIPTAQDLAKPERLAIDYENPAELQKRLEKAISALEIENSSTWKALQAHGIFHGTGQPGRVAFLFPGQGSQYVNMLLDLYQSEPVVRDVFDEADRVMTPILGRPLTSYIYTDGSEEELKQAEQELKNTAITQPAMLTANVAMLRLLGKYGIKPELAAGHSLGEYAALVAASVLTFAEALEVVSARGREMTRLKMEDQGCMAAVSAPLEKVHETLEGVNGYAVIANINSPVQCVLGGETRAIDEAIARFTSVGFQAVKIPVSHAFHTRIVAPASAPLREVIARMNVQPPQVQVIANVTGELYPTTRERIIDILARQVASPVQFVKTMQTLYEQGARIFIECGPKRVLNALAVDNLKDRPDTVVIGTNHPRKGGRASFNEALCAAYAAGIPLPSAVQAVEISEIAFQPVPQAEPTAVAEVRQPGEPSGSVVISGAGLGLPGLGRRVFDDANFERILNGEMMIEPLSEGVRQSMLEKHVTRLVKSDAGAVMEEVTSLDQVLKLSGQGGYFDLEEEFGVPHDRVESLDISTQLAMAAGIEALRDAAIPLVMNYRRTTRGSFLPDRWKLPECMQDETGVIFGSAFPGLNRMADEAQRYYEFRSLERQLAEVQQALEMAGRHADVQADLLAFLEQRKNELAEEIRKAGYQFDRRFIFRVLSMGHSQFAEYIGARGPNTHVNAACATTTHAVSLAEDWIRAGRCRRVVVIAGDDVTNQTLMGWIGTSMFASGAATTEQDVRMAAMPFDRRRNGMIMGMGAAALVIESEDAARERGVRAIGEILATHTANSAFHGTRLDVQHVSEVMDKLLHTAEQRFGVDRQSIAAETIFMSHETYTPARGGSASAEIHALRSCFDGAANRVIVANTKGFTGHSMGVGIEDVVALKALETGKVPPIANIGEGFEPDPELGNLNLSQGGLYHPRYALRLGAGFGSQVAMSLVRRIPGVGERIDRQKYSQWLAAAAGLEEAELEVVQRTLRVKNQGVPSRQPAQSTWVYGTGPSLRAASGPGHELSRQSALVPEEQKPEPSSNVQIVEPAPDIPDVQPAPVGADTEATRLYVLGVVSEKTGYPAEMLDLELDLEADLGIDTVKQAELFAAIRTHYGIPRREDLRLSDYNTLAKVTSFVTDALAAQENPSTHEPSGIAQPHIELASTAAIAAQAEPILAPDGIKEHVLGLVSEKTGYPVEMLDLELDLEADLGIDTVKQAELFAAVRNHYGIPRREDLRLSDYNTLAKVIGFVSDALASRAAPAPEPVALPAEAETPKMEESQPQSDVTRRVTVPVLFPRADLCQPTGIILEGADVAVVGSTSKVSASLARRLKAAGAQVHLIEAAEPNALAESLSTVENLAGVYNLLGLEPDPDWDTAGLQAWLDSRSALTVALFHLGRSLPEKAFLVSAVRMGGLHGLINPANPLGGLVSGFTKALRRERAGMLAKVVDFDERTSPAKAAEALVNETLRDPVSAELGYENGLRYGTALRQADLMPESEALKSGSVFVISGGTGGITAPVIRDLAKACRGHFYLLGRTRLPDKNEPDLQKLKADRSAFRTELNQRLKAAGEKLTPVQLEEKVNALERGVSTLETMAAVEAAGGKAVYIPCDVSDPASAAQAAAEVARQEQQVDVFIHAAGMDHSRKIENKPLEEFDQVVAVKADGFAALFNALNEHDLRPVSVVFFSSVAGRFGNSGQTDYSAANDLLNKLAAFLPARYPGLKAVSIAWGAWAESGMASRGHISELMRMAGIEMLKPSSAAPLVRAELESGSVGEVVIAGALGSLEQPAGTDEGLDVTAGDAALRAGKPIHTMFSHLTGFDARTGIRLQAELDPEQISYLRDHAINGIPVLPGVIGIEGFTTAAKHIASTLASSAGGFEVERLEDIRFLAPLKFYGSRPRQITWHASAWRQADDLKVDVSLESEIRRANGSQERMLHFTGHVYLSTSQPQAEASPEPPVWRTGKTVGSGQIYQLYFHGPSFQVLESAQASNGKVLGRFNKKLVRLPGGTGTPVTPLLIELCFQTAGLFEAGATGVMALPSSIGSLVIYRQPLNGVPIYAEVEPRAMEGGYIFDARVVDGKGNVFLELCDYRTSPLPYPVEKELVEPLKVLVPGGGDPAR